MSRLWGSLLSASSRASITALLPLVRSQTAQSARRLPALFGNHWKFAAPVNILPCFARQESYRLYSTTPALLQRRRAEEDDDEVATEDEDVEVLPLDLVGTDIQGAPRRRGKDWVAQLHIRGFDPNALDYACQYVLHVADAVGVRTGNIVPLPSHRRLFTVLRSPHVHKKARDQFEWKAHKRLICIYDTAPKAVDDFIKELADKSPISVQIKCKRRTFQELPASA